MIEAAELDVAELIETDFTARSLVAVPSVQGEWAIGYDEVVRAALAFQRGAAFLSRHWEELDADTRASLLRSIEAAAHDVTRLLGAHRPRPERPLLDEALAARLGSL
jgi:hypothetical protein